MGFEISYSRREIISKTFAAGAVGLLASTASAAPICKATPAQGEGPFYPEKDLDRDSDLLSLKPGGPQAKGQIIRIAGKVLNEKCEPLEDAVVEIWQACESGRYNHSDDNNPLPLDPNFQYWGRARTDKEGKYLFRSIIPGHYPIGGGSYRPPHIHFKVHAKGFKSLTSQMYFDPNSYDDPKLKEIVKKLNQAENVNKSLIVLFSPLSSAEKGGTFDITVGN